MCGCVHVCVRVCVRVCYALRVNILLFAGVITMWRGCGPTVARAVVLNAAQLATYDQAKQIIKGMSVAIVAPTFLLRNLQFDLEIILPPISQQA